VEEVASSSVSYSNISTQCCILTLGKKPSSSKTYIILTLNMVLHFDPKGGGSKHVQNVGNFYHFENAAVL
jgi:hypothetical protein